MTMFCQSLQRPLLCFLLALVTFGQSVEALWDESKDANVARRIMENRRFLTRHGRESLARKRQLAEEKSEQDERKLVEVSSSASPLNVLVIPMQWTNHPDRNLAVTKEDFEKLFNGEGRDDDLYPGGSVKDYFKAMSYGDFEMNFVVQDWIMTDFADQDFTADGSQGRTQELQRAFETTLEWLDGDLFNFRDFDSNFDKDIDVTIFLHSGYDGTFPGNDCETGATPQQRIASHARTGSDLSDWVSRAGFRLGAYAVAPAFRRNCDTEIIGIGTIVHELIHTFGIPDLYDMDGGYEGFALGGIDRFGVMASPQGAVDGSDGVNFFWPGHISAWTRQELGWIEPTVIDTDGTYELRPIENFPDMYKITAGFENKEYLLIENRQPIEGDFDENFFSPGGILIYHVDENIWNEFDNGGPQGNHPRGGPFQEGWPGNGRHYPVALLQADGLYELEQGINSGESSDIWNKPWQVLGPGNGEKVASSATYPNTDSYAFGIIKTTGITIGNFQTKGDIMTFELCGLTGECPDDWPTKPPQPPVSGMEELSNGSCDIAADEIRVNDSYKYVSNIGNGMDSETCHDGGERKGGWYKVPSSSMSPGEIVQANTCFPETNAMNEISVFKGEDCTALECVQTDEISCKNGFRGHVVYWVAEPEEDYYVFAHAVKDSEELADVDTLGNGSVLLNVLNFPPVDNDDCGLAIAVSTDGSVVSGSTEGATPESTLTTSETCGIESAGVWFKVNGTGLDLRATTCLPGTDHPTQIHVFSGSCDSLTCISVEANNYGVCSDFDIATNSATVNWESEEGEEYFILVGSRDGSFGNFELSITEFDEPADNDHCPNATPIVIPGTETVITGGATKDATNDFPYGERFCGAPLDTAGVWYTIEGTGDGLSVSTCGQNDYNSAISIFTGNDCGELQCYTGIATRDPSCNYGGVTAAWLSDVGETYHVYVHGSAQNSYGTFDLQVEKFTNVVENGFCNEALPITDPGVYIRATTLNATHSAPTNVCGAETVHPGLWYTFEGTGAPFYITSCPLDSINVTVSLFEGDNCGELSCISGTQFTRSMCGTEPETNDINVRFLQKDPAPTVLESEVGKTYYMFIHGQVTEDTDNTYDPENGVGGFDIKFFSGSPPPPPEIPETKAPKPPEEDNDKDKDKDKDEDEDKGKAPVQPIESFGNEDFEDIEGQRLGRREMGFIFMGVGFLLLCIFLIPPCWMARDKWCCCLRKKEDDSDASKPPDDFDMEEAPFTEGSASRSKRSAAFSDEFSSRPVSD